MTKPDEVLALGASCPVRETDKQISDTRCFQVETNARKEGTGEAMEGDRNRLSERAASRREHFSCDLENDKKLFYKDLGAEPSKQGEQNEQRPCHEEEIDILGAEMTPLVGGREGERCLQEAGRGSEGARR